MSDTHSTVTRIDRPPRGSRVRVVLYALAAWIGLAVLGVANGIFRGLVLEPALGPGTAHLVDSLLVAVPLFLIAIYLYIRYVPVEHSVRELALVGVLWTTLTVAFEFLFGHYVMGHPWSRLLADYDLLAGRVWVVVLLAILIGPLLVGHYLPRWLGRR